MLVTRCQQHHIHDTNLGVPLPFNRILLHALKRFVATSPGGCEVPLKGSIPDMTSTSETFIELQQVVQLSLLSLLPRHHAYILSHDTLLVVFAQHTSHPYVLLIVHYYFYYYYYYRISPWWLLVGVCRYTTRKLRQTVFASLP
jgi:hypothetical protein